MGDFGPKLFLDHGRQGIRHGRHSRDAGENELGMDDFRVRARPFAHLGKRLDHTDRLPLGRGRIGSGRHFCSLDAIVDVLRPVESRVLELGVAEHSLVLGQLLLDGQQAGEDDPPLAVNQAAAHASHASHASHGSHFLASGRSGCGFLAAFAAFAADARTHLQAAKPARGAQLHQGKDGRLGSE